MKRLLAAACAAVLLTGSLTACSSRTDKNSTNTANGADASPSGTAYSMPGQVRYPAGAAEDRAGYSHMTNSRVPYDGTSDGRYTAYSDGTVAPGHDPARNANDFANVGRDTETLTGDVARGAGDLVRGAGDAVEDIGTGIGNAARDITNG